MPWAEPGGLRVQNASAAVFAMQDSSLPVQADWEAARSGVAALPALARVRLAGGDAEAQTLVKKPY
jgi:hypothetical protein